MYRAGLFVFALVAIFQFFSLNYPYLNGDEALTGVIAHIEILRILEGHLPRLTPVIDYAGPFDLWMIFISRFLVSWIPGWIHQAWELRIGSYLFFLVGTAFVAREIKHRDQRLAGIFLLLIASSPLAWIHSRINWSSSYLLGCFSFLLAEILRERRTQKVNWVWLGFLSGLTLEFHPSGALGLLGLAYMNREILISSILPKRKAFLLGTFVFLLVALPELRHFPPPVGGAGERGESFLDEIPYLLGTIIGRRPILMRYGQDTIPTYINALFFLAFLPLVILGWKALKNTRPLFKRDILTLSVVSFILIFTCYLHRSLRFLGHERYLNFIFPIWAYLIAEGVFSFYCLSEKRKKLVTVLLGILVLTQQFRLTTPLIQSMKMPDPTLSASQWLVENCPRSSCLAFAESFWNFWPILYYSDQKIDLNVDPRNWHTIPPQHKWTPHSPRNREIAGCWYQASLAPQKVLARKSFTTLGQLESPGQSCFLGIGIPTNN